jgi:5'/3'-nucleotidase SurE
MRILLTNDDGIEAEGLECLERIARTLSDDVWVCAPQTEQSGKGRGITLTEPTGPNSAAVAPDSNSPSWLDAPMKIELTAATRPRISSGVSNCISV